MTEKVVVQFAGDGSGVAELSWGQQEIWSVIQAKGNSLPMGGARALPPGQTVADVAAGLRFIMSRHQALRTRLRFGPDGQTQQVVHASGAITLEVVDAGDSDPGEVAAAVAAEYKARNFDYENEWPLRMAVITHHGNATHVAQMICHIALDAFGLAVLYDDFDHRDERTGPVTAMQPMEQASRQHGPSGRRAHEASMRYLERLTASVPDCQFKATADPRQPRFWQVTLDSPAGYRAMGMLAARLGLGTSPVLLAAFAVALASVSVSPRVAAHLVVSNRFRPRVRRLGQSGDAGLPGRDRDGRPVRGSGQTGLAVRARRVQARLLRSGRPGRGVRAARGRARRGAGLERGVQRPPGAQPRVR